jgi:hypothetical protein
MFIKCEIKILFLGFYFGCKIFLIDAKFKLVIIQNILKVYKQFNLLN